MNPCPKQVTILVPVYRNAATLRSLYDQVRAAVAEVNASARFVFVDDAGGDGSLDIIRGLAQSDPDLVLVVNRSNCGQQRAIRKGLAHAAGQDVIVMDADLQDPPSAIPQMLTTLWDSGADAVFATRVGAYQSRFRMASSHLYRALVCRMAALPRGAGGFVALRGELAARLVASGNSRFHLAGMIGCHATTIESISVRRNHRTAGRSAYTGRMRLTTALSNFACILEERLRYGSL